MRALLIARNQHIAPPEIAVRRFQGFAAWREEYKGNMEVFFFFAGVTGGGAILNVTDEAALNQMMTEWPLAPFSHVTIEPIIDGDVAIPQYIAAMQAMQAAMQGGQR